MKSEIPAGHQIHVTTWENDGDHYATQVLNGLSAEDVRFYAELLPLFKSRSQGGFANRSGIDKTPVIEAITKTMGKHPKISTTLREQFVDDLGNVDIDSIMETMGDLLGCSEHADFRVFAGLKVFYYEKPVKEVTKKFFKM